MAQTIWQTLARPIVGLAPMDGVTDSAYRSIQKKYGHPDLMYTEFTSVEGLCHNAVKLLQAFAYEPSQQPVIAQVFGITPAHYRQVAVMLCELGFVGIDINMGCPAQKVHRHGSGAGLILTPELAVEIVRQTALGIKDFENGKRSKDCPDFTPRILKIIQEWRPAESELPAKVGLSLKTRIGYYAPMTEIWIKTLLETEVEAITIHGRTLKQQYSGLANWEEIGKAVDLAKGTGKLILGNGDVNNRVQALEKCRTYGVDGVLIGRASFGDPFVFLKEGEKPSASIYEIAVEHCRLHEIAFPNTPEHNSFSIMRKHLGWYTRGIVDASQIRKELFLTNNTEEVREIFRKYQLID